MKSLLRSILGTRIEYTSDVDRIDFAAAHEWLSNTYWSRGIARKRIEQGFRASTAVVSAHCDGQMKGIARCLCDTTRFGYIADVFVAPDMRGRGVARDLVRHLVQRSDLRETEHWYLMTRDAHQVYRKLGFQTYERPERWMHLDTRNKDRR